MKRVYVDKDQIVYRLMPVSLLLCLKTVSTELSQTYYASLLNVFTQIAIKAQAWYINYLKPLRTIISVLLILFPR